MAVKEKKSKEKVKKDFLKKKGEKAGLTKLPMKTPDGEQICFTYANGKNCTRKDCSFLHVCQLCFGKHPNAECPKAKSE